MNKISRFNIRVYFLLFDEGQKHVLVSDELIRGQKITKFPGGGLEYGEGLRDGAMREALEELGQPIRIKEHFYTTDFFVQSAFNPQDQVISVYYLAELISDVNFRIVKQKHDFYNHDSESFRWVEISGITPSDFNFPADQKAVELILQKFELS